MDRFFSAVLVLTASVLLPALCSAQVYTYKAPSSYPTAASAPAYGSARPAPATAPAASAPLKPEEVEALAAPIALYPDSLLAQILMASTYPLEVVQAERWVKANPSFKDNATELNKLSWDPSVKSLIDFPQVLTMMSEKLDWTVKLGDAFIANQKIVMDAVQKLRGKAYSQGSLKDSNEQKVKVETTAATATQPAAQVIVVESAQPNVVYVPTYNPTVVYGGWPYPAYPPAYYAPPSYVAGTALVSFGVGMAVGAAWGHAWGGCNWGSSEVDVDVDRNVNFNSNIDREAFRNEQNERQANRQGNQDARQGSRDARQANRQANGGRSGASTFQHNPSHRQGVAYRDAGTTERFRGAGASQQMSAARDSYRGRTQSSGAGFNASGGQLKSLSNTGARGTSSGGSAGTRSGGFSGAGSSGASARAASSRGQASRSSSSYSGSRGGYSGGARSGGGIRGGGGMRGGGGRGGGRR